MADLRMEGHICPRTAQIGRIRTFGRLPFRVRYGCGRHRFGATGTGSRADEGDTKAKIKPRASRVGVRRRDRRIGRDSRIVGCRTTTFNLPDTERELISHTTAVAPPDSPWLDQMEPQ